MEVRQDSSSIQANLRGRHERKGLEAIFTPQNERISGEVLMGAAGVLAGLVLSALAGLKIEDPQGLGAWGTTINSPLAVGSIGFLLLTWGMGTMIFAFTHHESRHENTMASLTTEDSEVDLSKDTKAPIGTRQMKRLGSRIGALAFVQSIVLVALYSGFVQEYESNSTMQTWVRSNLPVGQPVLNWEAVLIFSFALGLLLLQFLPEGFFSE